MQPIIALTMGDPAGIGPEIILNTFRQKQAVGHKLLIIGDLSILERVKIELRYDDLSLHVLDTINSEDWINGAVNIWDMKLLDGKDFQPGVVSKASGNAAFQYVIESIRLANEGVVSAVVTAPINKEAMQSAGHHYAGHTEIFAAYTDTKNYAMLLHDDKFSVIHVSTHIPLADAISTLNQPRLERVIKLADDSMKKILGRPPRIAVAGLNPHAGENGLFGQQEIEIIAPAIAAMKEKGIDVSGPFPPDTIFLKSLQGQYDIVVAMYHDQGHIPMKLLGFDTGVNVSVGLPIIRTSVDHGTAFDIAWKGIAKNDSLLKAISLAAQLAT